MPTLQHPNVTSFVIDKSSYVPAPSGSATIIFGTASRGPVNKPVSITNVGELHTVFGTPDYNKLMYGLFAAEQVLNESGPVWFVRVEATAAGAGIVVPTHAVMTVYDGTTPTAKSVFVATAKSEGVWANDYSITLTKFDQVYNATKGTWAANTAYNLNDSVTPTVANGLKFVATTAGTSGATEPVWPTTVGATVTDGTITWKAVAPTVMVSFNVADGNGVVVETFNNVDLSTIDTVSSDYFTFAAGTGTAPWVAPTVPVTVTVGTAGGTAGTDNLNAASNPYTNTATVAGWISNAINAGVIDDKNLFPADLVLAPGYANASTIETLAVLNDLVGLANRRGDLLVISEVSKGLTAQAAIAERATVGFPSEPQHCTDPYYPWLKDYDPNTKITRILPPSGYVAAAIRYNDKVGEIWTAPAGIERGVIRGAEGFEDTAQVDDGSQDLLFPGGVNTITWDPNLRVMYINAQLTATFTPSKRDRIHVARLTTYIQEAVTRYAQTFKFRPNVQETWDEIAGGVRAWLADIQARQGLEAFKVICDATTNTPVRRDRNELWLEIHVVPVGTAEFIYIPITIHRSGALG